MKIRILLLCGAMLVPSTGWSVNCANAVNVTEKAICSYPNVRASDDRMANQYWSLMHRFNAKGQDFLKKNQIAWIQERQNVCGGNAECLLSYNNERYHDLSQVIQQFDVAMKQPAQPSPYVPTQQSYVQQPPSTYSATPSYGNHAQPSNGGSDYGGWETVAALGITALLLNEMAGDVFGGGIMGGSESSSSFTPKEHHHHKHEDKQVNPYSACTGGLYGDCHNPNYQSWK
jgi:uncharacterized protein